MESSTQNMENFKQDALYNLIYFNSIHKEDKQEELDVESFRMIFSSDKLKWFLEYVDEYDTMFNFYIYRYETHPIFEEYFDCFIENYPDFSQTDVSDCNFLMRVIYNSEKFGDDFMKYFMSVFEKTPDIYHRSKKLHNILNIACFQMESDVITFLIENYDFDIVTNNYGNEYESGYVSLLDDLCNNSNKYEERIRTIEEFISKGCPVKFENCYFYRNLIERETDENSLNFIFGILDTLIRIDFFETNKDNFIDTIISNYSYDSVNNFMNKVPKDKFVRYIDYFITNGYEFTETYVFIINFDIELFRKIISHTSQKNITKNLNKFLKSINTDHIEFLSCVLESFDFEDFNRNYLTEIFKSIYRNKTFTFEMKRMIIDKFIQGDHVIQSKEFCTSFFNRCDSDSLRYLLENTSVSFDISMYNYLTCHCDESLIELCFAHTFSIKYKNLNKFINNHTDVECKIFNELYKCIDKIDEASVPQFLIDGIEYLNDDDIISVFEKYEIKNIVSFYLKNVSFNKIKVVEYLREKYDYLSKLTIVPVINTTHEIHFTMNNISYFKEMLDNTKPRQFEIFDKDDITKSFIGKVNEHIALMV